MEYKIAIIVCTYNPNEIIFERVLNSITKLISPPNIELECIIVDNNSTIPLKDISYIDGILQKNKWIHVISEKKQGLTNARIAGFKHTNASLLVFFDDDNEVHSNYLISIPPLIIAYPFVGVWGPGRINVEFIKQPLDKWILSNKSVFQEKTQDHIQYGCIRKWESYFPAGTGQVVKREVIEEYYNQIRSGQITLSDRSKDNLSSGGDVQIVFTAIRLNMCAGISPELKINHLISESKTRLSYIKKLYFGTSSSYKKALVQIFPSEYSKIHLQTTFEIIKQILFLFTKNTILGKYKQLQCELAAYAGDVVGNYNTMNKPTPLIINILIKILSIN